MVHIMNFREPIHWYPSSIVLNNNKKYITKNTCPNDAPNLCVAQSKNIVDQSERFWSESEGMPLHDNKAPPTYDPTRIAKYANKIAFMVQISVLRPPSPKKFVIT